MKAEQARIYECLLAPWQKLDAVRSFVFTRLDLILRGARVAKGPLRGLDKDVK